MKKSELKLLYSQFLVKRGFLPKDCQNKILPKKLDPASSRHPECCLRVDKDKTFREQVDRFVEDLTTYFVMSDQSYLPQNNLTLRVRFPNGEPSQTDFVYPTILATAELIHGLEGKYSVIYGEDVSPSFRTYERQDGSLCYVFNEAIENDKGANYTTWDSAFPRSRTYCPFSSSLCIDQYFVTEFIEYFVFAAYESLPISSSMTRYAEIITALEILNIACLVNDAMERALYHIKEDVIVEEFDKAIGNVYDYQSLLKSYKLLGKAVEALRFLIPGIDKHEQYNHFSTVLRFIHYFPL